ncbi:MAG: hypothetical protein CMM45_02745 [Rhodospirillaceae bacterium]|nr:hypothetical protein [Rhodospirillaceae bacterium]
MAVTFQLVSAALTPVFREMKRKMVKENNKVLLSTSSVLNDGLIAGFVDKFISLVYSDNI